MHLCHDDAQHLVDALALLEQTCPPDSKRAVQCRLLAATFAEQHDIAID